MGQGIAIIGLNGCGKSTLNHALCKRIGFFEMDVEDYYFPHQQESRRWALEHSSIHPGQNQLPYAQPQTREQVSTALLRDMDTHPQFVFSCVRMNWEDALHRRIGLAFLVQAPLNLRLERIQRREEKRFGARTMPGGDMFEQQLDFRQMAAHRDPDSVKSSAAVLACPVLMLDGTQPIEENVNLMVQAIQKQFNLPI